MSTVNARPAWMEPGTKIGAALKVIALIIVAAIVIYPILTVVTTSLSSEQEITRSGGLVLFPTEPTLAAYRTVLGAGAVVRGLLVSVVITAVGTVLSLTVTVLLAYALTRPGVTFGRPVLLFVIFTLFSAPASSRTSWWSRVWGCSTATRPWSSRCC